MRIIITEKQFRKILKRELAFTLAKLGYQLDGKKIAHHKSPSTDNTHNWKDFWQENQPLRSFPSRGQICPSCLLKKTIFVGGHVIIEDHTYIVPVNLFQDKSPLFPVPPLPSPLSIPPPPILSYVFKYFRKSNISSGR